MDKRILKKIAKEWCQAILLANGTDSFAEIDKDLLTQDEQFYIVSESHRIAHRITNEPPVYELEEIIKKYYTLK